MPREQNPLVVLDDASPARLLAGATVEVRHRAGSSGTDGTLAPVYAAETGAGLVASPFVTNVVGRAVGYHEPGKYRLTAQHGDLAAPYVEDFDVNPYDASFASGLMPTADEKAALAGTFGAPGNTNRYVTKTDQARQGRITRSALQPIPNTTVTPIQFTAEAFDLPNNDQHDNVTNNTRFTCVEAGFYTIGATWQWTTFSVANSRIAYIYHGAVQIGEDWRPGNQVGGTMSAPDRLAVGDIVEFRVWQDSGFAGGLNLASAALWWIRQGP